MVPLCRHHPRDGLTRNRGTVPALLTSFEAGIASREKQLPSPSFHMASSSFTCMSGKKLMATFPASSCLVVTCPCVALPSSHTTCFHLKNITHLPFFPQAIVILLLLSRFNSAVSFLPLPMNPSPLYFPALHRKCWPVVWKSSVRPGQSVRQTYFWFSWACLWIKAAAVHPVLCHIAPFVIGSGAEACPL